MNPVAKNASMFNLQKVLARKLDENESELLSNKSNGAKKFKRWICLNIIYDIKVKIKIQKLFYTIVKTDPSHKLGAKFETLADSVG